MFRLLEIDRGRILFRPGPAFPKWPIDFFLTSFHHSCVSNLLAQSESTHGNECRWMRWKNPFRGKLICLRILCWHLFSVRWQLSKQKSLPPIFGMNSVITRCVKIAGWPRMSLDSRSELIKLKRTLKTMISVMGFLFKPSGSLICHVVFKGENNEGFIWFPLQ